MSIPGSLVTVAVAETDGVVTGGIQFEISANGSKFSADRFFADGTTFSADRDKLSTDGTKFSANQLSVDDAKFFVDGAKVFVDRAKFSIDGAKFSADGAKFSVDSAKFSADGAKFPVDGTKLSEDGAKFSTDIELSERAAISEMAAGVVGKFCAKIVASISDNFCPESAVGSISNISILEVLTVSGPKTVDDLLSNVGVEIDFIADVWDSSPLKEFFVFLFNGALGEKLSGNSKMLGTLSFLSFFVFPSRELG